MPVRSFTLNGAAQGGVPGTRGRAPRSAHVLRVDTKEAGAWRTPAGSHSPTTANAVAPPRGWPYRHAPARAFPAFALPVARAMRNSRPGSRSGVQARRESHSKRLLRSGVGRSGRRCPGPSGGSRKRKAERRVRRLRAGAPPFAVLTDGYGRHSTGSCPDRHSGDQAAVRLVSPGQATAVQALVADDGRSWWARSTYGPPRGSRRAAPRSGCSSRRFRSRRRPMPRASRTSRLRGLLTAGRTVLR